MKTTTRYWIRKIDIYYDGISYGTPVGQIMFCWENSNDSRIAINVIITFDDGTTKENQVYDVDDARKYANGIIKRYINEIKTAR